MSTNYPYSPNYSHCQCLTQQCLFLWRVEMSVVRPLLKKKGLDLQEKNYCPVSNLPFLSKLVEWATLTQFDQQCREHQLLPDFQLTYRKGYSTETSLIKITNDILWSMERKEITAMIVLDMSATFDTVDHDLLLDILHNRYGIVDTALQWYWSYLRPQGMKVFINNAYSSIRTLNFSVLQESASGANLFTAYCAPIKSVIPAGITINRFTNNYSIRKPFNADSQDQESPIYLINDGHGCKHSLLDGYYASETKPQTKLSLSCLAIEINYSSVQPAVTISDSTIPKSPSIKYLGVTLDENLNLKEHILTKCRKAIANFVRIRNIHQYLTKDACTTLVLGLCISRLDYANALYYGLSNKQSHTYRRYKQCVQNSPSKSPSMIAHGKHLHSFTGSLLKQRINFKIATITHKWLYRTAPQYLKDLLILAPTPRSLRSSNDKTRLIIPFTKWKTFVTWSFSISAPSVWNQLLMSLQEISNFELFKWQLKTHFYWVAFYWVLHYRNSWTSTAF